MSKTYRNAFIDELDDVDDLKIKHVDHKHQRAKITDGSHKHGFLDEDSGEYYDTPTQKKEFKKSVTRKNRKFKDMDFDD